MKFKFENLGALTKKTEIELADLTILCGANNTGKTYATRAIYGFLKTWENNIDFNIDEDKIQSLLENGVLKIDLTSFEKKIPDILNQLSKKYTASLPNLFNASEYFFSSTTFNAACNGFKPNYQKALQKTAGTKIKEVLKVFKDKDSSILDVSLLVEDKNLIPHPQVIKDFLNKSLGQALLGDYFANPFIITSERSGISLFYRELDINKYAYPVMEDIDFVRRIVELYSKQKSELLKNNPEIIELFNNIVGGEYKIENDQISFVSEQNNKHIPLYLSSAMVVSQVELNFYLKCLAKQGDILLFDEPEQNLHPANQRKIARLFVRLIKAGIKVFISTHSDYLIKELNNLIVLNNEFADKNEIMKKYHYTKADILDKSLVKTYITEKHSLISADIDDMGIEVTHFDKEIDEMNQIYDDMLFAMEA